MIFVSSAPGQAGQALIEFIIVIPVLVLLMAASWTLLAYQAFPVWVDEFLNLGISMPDGEQVFRELAWTHDKSMIPPYPAREKFHWNTVTGKPIKFPPPLSAVYPGRSLRARIVLDPVPMVKKCVPFSGLLPADPTPLDRGLTYQALPTYEDKDVKSALEKIVSGGVKSGAFISALQHIGIDLVHLNLDALPTPAASTGYSHGN